MSTSDTTNALLTGNDQLTAGSFTVGRAGAVEGSLVYPRGTTYGESVVQNLHGLRTPQLAREGTYWVATNTQGTPIVDGNASSFAATTPVFALVNNNALGGAWVYPVRLTASITAVGTSSSNFLSRWLTDTGNRYSSGGTQLTPTNPNYSTTVAKTGALVYFGAITATAASSSRTLHVDQLRSVIPVAQDEYTFEFGSSASRSVGMPTDGTLQLSKMVMLPPIAIPPQTSLLWYSWGASQAAARSFDNINIEYIER